MKIFLRDPWTSNVALHFLAGIFSHLTSKEKYCGYFYFPSLKLSSRKNFIPELRVEGFKQKEFCFNVAADMYNPLPRQPWLP